jgi:AcrR family transcriptional regulator
MPIHAMPTEKAATKPDHRTLLGQERRERMQQRILSAALQVFAAKGGVPVIDDFIKAAGVARGTFYNYYDSVDQLQAATTAWLEEDLMQAIQHELEGIDDSADRLALGVRLWLAKAESDPLWCAFVARSVSHGQLVEDILHIDLSGGQRDGTFAFESVPAARDLVVGTLHEAMRRMAAGPVPAGFTGEVARLVFRGLGMPPRRITAAFRRPIPSFRREMLRYP